jgi:hypothetical protein
MAGLGNVKVGGICYNYAMNEKRISKLSDIAANLGLVFFASVFLDPILRGSTDIKSVIIGLIFTVGSWFFSLFLLS